MKSSGLNKSGISPAHVRKQRNCKYPVQSESIESSLLNSLSLLHSVVVGHSEDNARQAQAEDM